MRSLALALAALSLTACAANTSTVTEPRSLPVAEIDTRVEALMASQQVKGLALASIEDGKVAFVRAYGARNVAGDPLGPDTVMYGASLTKTVFAFLVAQLAAEGRIDLDRSIAEYLPKPLPEYADAEDAYAPWHHLAGDERWRRITPRMLLTHSAGFANFYWLNPDQKLRIHFDPGSRYAYSGDGLILLQFVLERGLGLDVGKDAERRIFAPFGMTRSSLIWRPEFRPDLADGWKADGAPEPHDERGSVRAAGSLDTTISDMARFAAGVMSGPPKLRDELFRPTFAIRSASQFPTLQEDAPPPEQVPGLAAGLGTVAFTGPQGRGFFKGGHNDWTGNMMICLEHGRRCLVMLGNDVRAERIYPEIAKLVLGDTGLPWRWEYGVSFGAQP